MDIDPELHGHHHKTGHQWVDLVVAASALLLSIASIIISVQHGRTMEQLVTANSWPYLQFGHGNVSDDGQSTIHLDVRNRGIGPALIEKFVVTYDGQPVADSWELLRRCCGVQNKSDNPKLNLYVDAVSGQVLPARENVAFFQLPKQESNMAVWEKLNVARFKVAMTACYSSVFGEHWITSLHNTKPRSVKSCDELTGIAYESDLYGQPMAAAK